MKKTLMILCLAGAGHAFAQSPFVTVKRVPARYCVETITDTADIAVDSIPVTDFDYDITADGKETVDSIPILRDDAIKRYLSVCMPLKEMKPGSGFGKRTNPFNHSKTEFHKGLDLKAKYTEAFAMMNGVVERVGSDKRSGNYVTLRHGDYTVSYCHMSRIFLTKGAVVVPGTIVGITGNTGRSTGPHLHLTVKYKKKHIDPCIVIDFVKNVQKSAIDDLVALGSNNLNLSNVIQETD